MPRPDDGLIHAWLDGELEAEEAARVEKLVAEDREWAAAAAEARGLIAASTRILGALDVVAGDVIPKGGSAAPATRAPRRVPTWMKVAASFVLVFGVAYLGRDSIEADENVAAIASTDTAALAQREAPAPAPAPAAPRDAQPAPDEDRLRRVAPSSRGAREDAAANAVPAPPTAERAKATGVSELSAAGSGAAGAAASPPPSAVAQAAGFSDSLAAAKKSAEDSARARRVFDTRSLRLEAVTVTGMAASDQSGRRKAAETPAPVAAASRAAAAAALAEPAPLPIIEGCFRVRTRARIDTLLIDPKILATDADSIRIQMSPNNGFAWVRRQADGALVGRVWWQGNRTANMRADPIDCS